jgi:Type II secretory pathway, prepilin signal peptidase PulO and related peptidases
MSDVLVIFLLFIVGAGVGSFLGVFVNQVIQKRKQKRSYCDKCQHSLIWSDMVPILSYIVLGGKCRYCEEKINRKYFLMEILVGCLFALSYIYLPINALELILWLAIVSVSMSLFLTDILYRKLPTRQIAVLTVFCLIFMFLTELLIEHKMYSAVVFEHIYSAIILTGLFSLTYIISAGKTIGFGDIMLSIPIAILLPWQGSLAVLFLASALAILFYFPPILRKKISANIKIPFGSFLIISTLFVFFMMELFVDLF